MKVFLLKDFTYSRLSCCNLHVWPGGGQVVKWLHLFELASNMVFLLLAKVLSSRVGFCSELCENVKLENVCSENKGGAKPSIKPFFWSSLCPPSLLHRTDLGTKSTNVWVDEGGGPGGGWGTHNSTEEIVKEQHVRFRQISPFLPDYAQTNVNCFKRFGFIKTNRLHDDRQMPVKFQITQRCRQRRRCRRSRRRWRRRPGTSGKTFSGTEAGRSSFGWTGLLKNWECLYKKYESPMEGKSKEGFSMVGQTFLGPCRQIDLVKKHWLCVLISHRVYIVYKPV